LRTLLALINDGIARHPAPSGTDPLPTGKGKVRVIVEDPTWAPPCGQQQLAAAIPLPAGQQQLTQLTTASSETAAQTFSSAPQLGKSRMNPYSRMYRKAVMDVKADIAVRLLVRHSDGDYERAVREEWAHRIEPLKYLLPSDADTIAFDTRMRADRYSLLHRL
jgi:hypothetical protein